MDYIPEKYILMFKIGGLRNCRVLRKDSKSNQKLVMMCNQVDYVGAFDMERSI